MPRLTLLLLLLALLATPTANGVVPFAATLLSSDRGWEMDPDGAPTSTSSEESPDSGWEMDPNG